MVPEARVAARVTQDAAARLALDLYGLDARARALPGEYDDNFHLCSNGRDFVLKVMHPARERGLVEMQCAALAHLARRAPALALPRVEPTRDGQPTAIANDAGGAERIVWMLTYVAGRVLADARPHGEQLLLSLGRLLGQLDRGLADFDHPAAHRELKWDMARAAWIRDHVHEIGDPSRRALVERFLGLYQAQVVPALPLLRHGIIHGDANDHNLVVGDPRQEPREVSLIDFGDMHHGLLVAEPAVAAAYAILGEKDPIRAAANLVAGYHAALPLQENEIALLHALVGMRLAVSVTNSAQRKRLVPDDPYVTISEAPAWEALERLAKVPERLAHYGFREACGLPPLPHGPKIAAWLEGNGRSAAPVLGHDLRTTECLVFDLSVSSLLLGADPAAAEAEALTRTLFGEMEKAGVAVGVGRYDEARALYSSELFGGPLDPREERRTVHLGIDLFAAPGSPIHAPLDGVVHAIANNQAPLDYGPLVILRHAAGDGRELFTLYGHLAEDTLTGISVGQRVERGQRIGRIGTPPTNGGWSPHVHFQIILDLLEMGTEFPGVAFASQRAIWRALSPDPNLLLGIPSERFPVPDPAPEITLARRRERLGSNVRLSYRKPLKIVRGFMQHLFDENAQAYLDVYNNVPLVGHSHPRVVRAVQEQIALLNTNTRYLHDNVVRYAERLTKLLPEPLRVCFFVNSGSEANELALRLARAHTKRTDVIVLEHAYHGNTTTLIDVSPYKFLGPGGGGRKAWVHVAPLPDDYRGRYRRDDPEAGPRYASHVAEIASRIQPAAFLTESLPSVAGQIVFPRGYLAAAYATVRANGGLCIADEVQTGFARLGSHCWGFETQRVVPDVVVLGKPIANGFPLGAVVTTPEIARSFDNGMEYFSTFAGNAVACAAGLAVLDVLAEERLAERALRVGSSLLTGLRKLQGKHALIGDVRGSGLFLGVELVRDRATREPATFEASYVTNRLRVDGMLTGTDGPHENVLKLRPPLCFGERDADQFLASLDAILAEDGARG